MSRLAIPNRVKESRRMSMEVTQGLDADLKARENAKRDKTLEQDACDFLTALTGMEINDMMEDLKVSVQTTSLINSGRSTIVSLLLLPSLLLLSL